jgi:hypothetical protein
MIGYSQKLRTGQAMPGTVRTGCGVEDDDGDDVDDDDEEEDEGEVFLDLLWLAGTARCSSAINTASAASIAFVNA